MGYRIEPKGDIIIPEASIVKGRHLEARVNIYVLDKGNKKQCTLGDSKYQYYDEEVGKNNQKVLFKG